MCEIECFFSAVDVNSENMFDLNWSKHDLAHCPGAMQALLTSSVR